VGRLRLEHLYSMMAALDQMRRDRRKAARGR
jgi:hypothetical protein